MSIVKQARQKTIGVNPLDHYLSMHQIGQETVQQEQVTQNTKEDSAETNITILEHTQEQQVILQEVSQETDPESVHEQDRATQDTDIIAQILQSEDMQGPKQRITLHICQELLERVKNAVFWEPGLTLAGFAHYALEKAVEHLEHERGAPFPDRKTRRLRSGRPLK
jgi:hypothetical protein